MQQSFTRDLALWLLIFCCKNECVTRKVGGGRELPGHIRFVCFFPEVAFTTWDLYFPHGVIWTIMQPSQGTADRVSGPALSQVSQISQISQRRKEALHYHREKLSACVLHLNNSKHQPFEDQLCTALWVERRGFLLPQRLLAARREPSGISSP